jgi:hypothetical protein
MSFYNSAKILTEYQGFPIVLTQTAPGLKRYLNLLQLTGPIFYRGPVWQR